MILYLVHCLPEYISSVCLSRNHSLAPCFSFSNCMGFSLLQTWSCEDSDVHQPLSVWTWGVCSVLWKLLLLCSAPLPPCHGMCIVSMLYVVVLACHGQCNWGNEKLMMWNEIIFRDSIPKESRKVSWYLVGNPPV